MLLCYGIAVWIVADNMQKYGENSSVHYLHQYCLNTSARNIVGQSKTILHISGQLRYCPDIVSELFRKAESNLAKTVAFHYEVYCG